MNLVERMEVLDTEKRPPKMRGYSPCRNNSGNATGKVDCSDGLLPGTWAGSNR